MGVVAGERTHVVAVRLNPSEYAAWSSGAKAAGRGWVGAWVRDRMAAALADDAKAAAGTEAVPAPAPAAVGVGGGVLPAAQVLAQLARVGNLLNQAVRHAHTGGVDQEVAERLVAAIDRAQTVMRVIHADLAAQR